ncbi:13982_t:CDS:2, partial [Cetraspora pellucida]
LTLFKLLDYNIFLMAEQTSLDSFVSYKSATTNKDSSPEESDNNSSLEELYDHNSDEFNNDNIILRNSMNVFSSSAATTSSQIPTKRKKVVPIYRKNKTVKSWIWKYTKKDKITKFKYCDIDIDKGNNILEKCNAEFKPRTAVTNITSHLHTVHRIYKDQKLDAPVISSVEGTKKPQTINSMLENIQLFAEKKQIRATYCLVSWLVESMMPLDCINHDRFRDFCYEVSPRFEVPCTNTIKNKIAESVIYTQSNLENLINETMISVCITTDLWTHNHTPFIGITSYWLTENFTMHQALIMIEHFEYPHTGDHIEDFLCTILTKWNIIDKLMIVTTDNAASMIKAIRQLGVSHLGCAAHSIHLAITDGLKKVQTEIIKKKNISSNSTDQSITLLDPISSDTSTQWNSTFLLLQRILDLRETI